LLFIGTALLEELNWIAQAAYPDECCGILLGCRAENSRWAELIFPAENAAANPGASFRLANWDIREAEAVALSRGMELVGFYHSHPDCEAAPSETDALYAIPGYSYPIISVWNGRAAAIRSFVKTADALIPEPIDRERGEWNHESHCTDICYASDIYRAGVPGGADR
jgi:proteasome lid subunit RPN8/RPN11